MPISVGFLSCDKLIIGIEHIEPGLEVDILIPAFRRLDLINEMSQVWWCRPLILGRQKLGNLF